MAFLRTARRYTIINIPYLLTETKIKLLFKSCFCYFFNTTKYHKPTYYAIPIIILSSSTQPHHRVNPRHHLLTLPHQNRGLYLYTRTGGQLRAHCSSGLCVCTRSHSSCSLSFGLPLVAPIARSRSRAANCPGVYHTPPPPRRLLTHAHLAAPLLHAETQGGPV